MGKIKKIIGWLLGNYKSECNDRLDAIKNVIEAAEEEEKHNVAEAKFNTAFKQYKELERMIDRTIGFNKLSFIQNCRKRILDNNYNRLLRGEEVRDLKMTA